ncbi:MAG: serine/threonine protein kinase [Verrucomicrobia bacterium]|nr:serine/threonine protein kinase [Verrucomicrobiota bacterium]
MNRDESGADLPPSGGSPPAAPSTPAARPLSDAAQPSTIASQPSAHVPDHELLRRIGGGSYGEVWLAKNAVGTLRAVKIVHRHTFEQEEHFEREFHGLQKFEPISRSHEGLVDILQIGRNDAAGYFYYVMELADDVGREDGRTGRREDGPHPPRAPLPSSRLPVFSSPPETYTPKTLRSQLRRHGPFALAKCLSLGLKLALALEHLHTRGLVHRDLKPSNIIFVEGEPKLADIGLVTAIDEAHSLVGTVGYIPPEGPGTPRADIYSLGKVLYEAAFGKDRQEFPQLPADLSRRSDHAGLLELNEVIVKACENDPHQRYESAAALHADLALLRSGRSVKRLHLIEARLATVTKAAAVVAALLLIATALFLAARHQAQATARRLYVADMNRALRAWESGNLVLARELLDTHRQRQPEMLGFEWRLIHRLCQESDAMRTFAGHEAPVECVALSPDGRLVVTGARDHRVKVWEADTGQLIRTLDSHQGIVHAVAFSHDGRLLASGGRDDVVRVWTVDSWQPRWVLRGHSDGVRSVVFAPDNQTLFSAGEDRTVRTWDLASGTERSELRIADDFKIEQMALSPNGDVVVTCGFSGKVRRWKLAPRARLPDLDLHTAHVVAVSFSPDGRLLASAGYDGTVQLWDMASESHFGQLGHGAPIRSLAFAPDGQTVATAARDSEIHLWDLRTRREVGTLRGHRGEASAVAFAPDGRTLASGSDDGTAKLWRVGLSGDWGARLLHRGLVNSLAFSADGQWLATADSACDTLRLWDVQRGVELTNFAATAGAVWCVAVSPDGKTVATGGVGQDTQLRLWDITGQVPTAVLGSHGAGIEFVAFSPDGKLAATASRDETVKLWDVVKRRPITTLAGRFNMVRCVAFSPDGKHLAAASRDGNLRLWQVGSWGEPAVLKGHDGDVWCVAFSRDGRWLASGDAQKMILLWDVKLRRSVGKLAGHAARITSLAFSPDGKTLASGSADSTVRLWNLRLREEVGTLNAHSGQVTSVAFSPDGSVLASASADGTVRLWRAAQPK